MSEQADLGFRAVQGALTLMTLRPCQRHDHNPSGSYRAGYAIFQNDLDTLFRMIRLRRRAPGTLLSDLLPPLDPPPAHGDNVVQFPTAMTEPSSDGDPFA